MANTKRSAKQNWRLCLTALLIIGVALLYRAFYPPLPSWIKAPPGSSVEVSRRFFSFMWGPQYYYRIHSLLPAQQTADYMVGRPPFPQQQHPEGRLALPVRSSDMSGWALSRTGNFVAIYYNPVGPEGTEIHTTTRIWPEASGSTIEYYCESSF